MVYSAYLDDLKRIPVSSRITKARQRVFDEPRYMSVEQALIVTEAYQKYAGLPRILKRAHALVDALDKIRIRIDPEELIVGNRTAGIRSGVVFPEAGVEWVDQELDTFPTRPQDKFNVRKEDKKAFREIILPYWRGRGLRDEVEKAAGPMISFIEPVVKINQKDHAQGHICPDVKKWIEKGPSGLLLEVRETMRTATGDAADFYEAMTLVLTAARHYIGRYARRAREMARERGEYAESLAEVARICEKLKDGSAETFHEALQSVWFLFAILHMESNANSFSPGRLDQILYPYFFRDFSGGKITLEQALELLDALCIKFNHIVYMRNQHSARYFAGFTTGFNVAIGGKLPGGEDGTNLLSFLFLAAQAHVRLSQPNLSARVYEGSPEDFLEECSRVIGLGTGMPQLFNDESVIPALVRRGIPEEVAQDYAIVGCVELTTPGDNLGWSDAAMFNLVKALELTMNNGACLLTGNQLGPETGFIYEYKSYGEFEAALEKQLDYFIDKMNEGCKVVDAMHARTLPSPFLSSVISDCIENGKDVTAGGARYNFTGIQAIQVANIADCLAVLKNGVFEEKSVDPKRLLAAMKKNFEDEEALRQTLLNKFPKYGNDIPWVDEIANKWIGYFERKVGGLRNIRGGKYQVGLYTVSAHVPMGLNVGATPDGRNARMPLADGGMSPVYGRDKKGPTAVLKSVSRVDSSLGSNGTLLNMKFTPEFFKTQDNIQKFSSFIRAFVRLKINHVQFNVVTREDLVNARKRPEEYRGLLVRVAGYTAYFTELAGELQEEIIERTTHGTI